MNKPTLTIHQAGQAIYIDFECLKGSKGRPPHAALLGVLIGGEGDEFEQLVLDPRLAPAVSGSRRRVRLVDPHDAVEQLVRMAAASDRSIVGWSYFDRDRLCEIRPDLETEIHARYVNALHIARPWAKAIYPDVPIERADDFAPRHTLDQYAALSRYPAGNAFVDPKPAEWIRTAVKKGADAREEFRKLLVYNRHDCRALRHIMVKAAQHMDAWKAYERTTFCVNDGGREVRFRVRSQAATLDALLRRHGATSFAFITAWNPESRQLSKEENDARQAALQRMVAAEGWQSLSGAGVGEDPSWSPEESLMILNIGRRQARSLGRRFGHLAIVYGTRNAAPHLVSTAVPPAVRPS